MCENPVERFERLQGRYAFSGTKNDYDRMIDASLDAARFQREHPDEY